MRIQKEKNAVSRHEFAIRYSMKFSSWVQFINTMTSNQQSALRKMTSIFENTNRPNHATGIGCWITEKRCHGCDPVKNVENIVDKPPGFDQPLGISYRHLINSLIWFILIIKGLMAGQHFYAIPLALVSTFRRCCTRTHTLNFYIAITEKTSGIEVKNRRKKFH